MNDIMWCCSESKHIVNKNVLEGIFGICCMLYLVSWSQWKTYIFILMMLCCCMRFYVLSGFCYKKTRLFAFMNVGVKIFEFLDRKLWVLYFFICICEYFERLLETVDRD